MTDPYFLNIFSSEWAPRTIAIEVFVFISVERDFDKGTGDGASGIWIRHMNKKRWRGGQEAEGQAFVVR